MRFSIYARKLCVLMLVVLPAGAQSAPETWIRRLAIASESPFQLQIQTSGPVVPQAQIVSSPERLIIDIPNALPGPALRGIPIKRGEVRGVRVGLFSKTPPVTRIVVDLNQPQWYRITPDASGVLVSLGTDAESAAAAQPTIGWVSARTAVSPASNQGSQFELRKVAAKQRSSGRLDGVRIQFAGGMMTIHSGGASLSEILFQIQKVTGAEIAIPAGTEQERVAADFGPGPVSEVLGQLLNGSGLNFVVVGSEADPKLLRSVILSRKSGPTESAASAQAYTPAPSAAENVAPDNIATDPIVPDNPVPENIAPPNTDPDQTVPQQPPPPGAVPVPEPPQN
jgi:AMIN domain-containing protein